jgi:hypothetical protein
VAGIDIRPLFPTANGNPKLDFLDMAKRIRAFLHLPMLPRTGGQKIEIQV